MSVHEDIANAIATVDDAKDFVANHKDWCGPNEDIAVLTLWFFIVPFISVSVLCVTSYWLLRTFLDVSPLFFRLAWGGLSLCCIGFSGVLSFFESKCRKNFKKLGLSWSYKSAGEMATAETKMQAIDLCIEAQLPKEQLEKLSALAQREDIPNAWWSGVHASAQKHMQTLQEKVTVETRTTAEQIAQQRIGGLAAAPAVRRLNL